MTLITGRIEDSGGTGLSGILRVTLDAPLIDTSDNPDATQLPSPTDFAIASGVVSINLTQSETASITYRFEFLTQTVTTSYYFPDGELYSGPKHYHTDNNWYTGSAHNEDSTLLYEFSETRSETLVDFHAMVPNTASCEFAALLPTGITTDILDTSLRRLAELLTNNTDYVEALRGGPRFIGEWSASTYYKLSDSVSYGGSSWIWIGVDPGVGEVPAISSTKWQLIAERGSGGTGGQDTAYNATGWDGQTWAPSANALRDIIEQLARISQLSAYAPIAGPTFTGNPTRSTPPAFGDRTSQLATTQWVGAEFAKLDNPVFTGNPGAPTQPYTNDSTRLATTAFVQSVFNQGATASLVVVDQIVNFSISTTAGAYTTINWNTVRLDSGAAYSAGVFTAPMTGWYDVRAMAAITTNGSNILAALGLFINGVMSFQWYTTSAQSFTSVNGSTVIQLIQNQQVSIRGLCTGTGVTTANIDGAATNLNRLSIRRLF